MATFFLTIVVGVVIFQLTFRSGWLNFSSGKRITREKRENLSTVVFYIKSATRGRAYGRREVAKILREAILTQSFARAGFPVDWIATPNGDNAVAQILRSKNSSELGIVFELPELSTRSRTASTTKGHDYLSYLARALSLIENKNNN